MKKTQIIFFGQQVTVICDEKCNKAWGINAHPRIGDEMIADKLLGDAPADPGTYEGGEDKNPGSHNRWCVRECERSELKKGWQNENILQEHNKE